MRGRSDSASWRRDQDADPAQDPRQFSPQNFRVSRCFCTNQKISLLLFLVGESYFVFSARAQLQWQQASPHRSGAPPRQATRSQSWVSGANTRTSQAHYHQAQQNSANPDRPARQPVSARSGTRPVLQPQQHAATSSVRMAQTQMPNPHHSCAEKTNELTVQIVPDIGSIMLLEPDSYRRYAAFAGECPPAHHTNTALHHFLECICPGVGGSFADVWLDIAHVTFATLKLPVSKLQMFSDLFTQAAAQLPPLSQCYYKIVGLKLYSKPCRREKQFKGDSFYYLDLESHTPDF